MTQDTSTVLLRIRQLAEPFIESLGLGLWGMEIIGGAGRPTLRLFLDGPQGVDVEHCAQVSRQLAVALEVEDLFPGAYNLEVSSPGLERRFFDISQLPPYIGRELDVTLNAPLGGRKRFKGAFTALDGRTLHMICEGAPVSFAWDDVARARLVHVFETPEESKARGRKTSKADKAAAAHTAEGTPEDLT
uniref:Ribosome maturation factor RimP n=1 Tax=Fundidesulfovibrio putealis TaxID=270496 RepID=A0A7C4AA38_9BACT